MGNCVTGNTSWSTWAMNKAAQFARRLRDVVHFLFALAIVLGPTSALLYLGYLMLEHDYVVQPPPMEIATLLAGVWIIVLIIGVISMRASQPFTVHWIGRFFVGVGVSLVIVAVVALLMLSLVLVQD